MERHDLDVVALVSGALFTVVGLGYAFARWDWSDFAGAWLLAMFLIGLGIVGALSASLRYARNRQGYGAVDEGSQDERDL